MNKKNNKVNILCFHFFIFHFDLYLEMMQTSVVSKQIASANTNRERKQKYNHPKGAPDADLIFGVRYLIYKTVSDYFIEFFFF